MKAGGKCYDLSQASRAAEVIRDGAGFLGGVDILVNCAGSRLVKPFLETTDEDVNLLFEVNAKATYLASREAARLMVQQGGGRILMIGSIYGERGAKNFSLYCATKCTMHNLARAMAVELGPQGLRVNCLMPGLTVSDRVAKNLSRMGEEHVAQRKEMIPNRRFGAVEEMADIALFLVSKQNDFMNGAMVASDGGWMAG
ncbi:MAG: SDR family oxidoreductase [Nitrospinota bacterium]